MLNRDSHESRSVIQTGHNSFWAQYFRHMVTAIPDEAQLARNTNSGAPRGRISNMLGRRPRIFKQFSCVESSVVIIPVDAHLLTLTISTPEIVERPVRVGRETRMQRERNQRTREIQTQRSAASLTLSFMEVNKIFSAADIEFRLRKTTSDSVEAPKGSEALDDNGFYMLAAGFPMNDAVSLLLVRRFAGSEGGASVEKLGVCAVGDSSPDTALAHEFGHLLGLEHQGDIRDLMNPGLSAPGTPLTSSEITDVRASRLFQRFGGRPSEGSH